MLTLGEKGGGVWVCARTHARDRAREREASLIDLPLKFKEIKFGNLSMNWLTQDNMLTYNKFSPVNCIHYLKCSINITHTILVAAEDP